MYDVVDSVYDLEEKAWELCVNDALRLLLHGPNSSCSCLVMFEKVRVHVTVESCTRVKYACGLDGCSSKLSP